MDAGRDRPRVLAARARARRVRPRSRAGPRDPTPGVAELDDVRCRPDAALPGRTGPGGRRARPCSPRTPGCWPRCPASPRWSPATSAGPGGRPLPLRLSTDPASWRDLLREARRAESELLAAPRRPADELRRELGLRRAAVRDRVRPGTAPRGDLADGTVLPVACRTERRPAALRLRYRTDVLDADAAGRIAGYHLAALGADGRRPGRRPRGRPCCRPTSCACRSTGWPARDRSCRTGGCTSCSSSRSPRTRTPSPPCRATAVDLPRAQRPRQPARPRAAGARAAARGRGRSRRPSATWTGWPRCSRSSRPAACTCRSSRTSRPTGSRPR